MSSSLHRRTREPIRTLGLDALGSGCGRPIRSQARVIFRFSGPGARAIATNGSEYEGWRELWAAAINFVDSVPPEAWSRQAPDALLQANARDDEDELLAEELMERPASLRALAHALPRERKSRASSFASARG